MTRTYRATVLTGKGGFEKLEIQELPLPQPGPGVLSPTLGERVALLAVYGGFGEVLVRRAEEFVPMPSGLDDAEAATLVLNYATAYQLIERVARLRGDELVLVTGASGGVGTALLELLRLKGVRVIAAASEAASTPSGARARTASSREGPRESTQAAPAQRPASARPGGAAWSRASAGWARRKKGAAASR